MPKRILSKERLREMLEADSDKDAPAFLGGYDRLVSHIEEMVRVETAELLSPRLVQKIEAAVRAEYALQQAPANADETFHRAPTKIYEATRDMTRGTRACLVRPMDVPESEAFAFAKWLESGRNDHLGTSIVLFWTRSLYGDFDPPRVDPNNTPDLGDLLKAARREASLAAKAIKVANTTRSLPEHFRSLYTQNRWGRWIWRAGGRLEQGSSPPAEGSIIADKALHQLLNFFSDVDVLHEVKSQTPRKATGERVWRWMLVAPARVAVIIRRATNP